MTTENLLNVSAAKNVPTAGVKITQEENVQAAEIFAAMMNQSMDFVQQGIEDASSEFSERCVQDTKSVANSYERYASGESKIGSIKKKEDTSVLDGDAAKEKLQQMQEDIIETISKEYGIDEETLCNLLEDMGLTALDLLNPQNLVNFMMTLTGAATSEELLLDENFLNVMGSLDALSGELMETFSVDKDGLQEIISLMDTVDSETVELPMEQLGQEQPEVIAATEQNAVEEVAEDMQTAEETNVPKKASEEAGNVNPQDEEAQVTETPKQLETAETPEREFQKQTKSPLQNQNDENGGMTEQNTASEQNFVTHGQVEVTGAFNETPQVHTNSYLNVDTLQMMEQLAEQIKVVVTPDTTSMEMQLNPEHLGKVYLHISSEEGVVSAQFTATNEVVKEALETQLAVLRENLVQAGVKVDAIEVTVASHEFEKNLEQGQQDAKEQIPEEKTSKRRNISVDSLDELQGIMTEEETLVAQIMKDNGNSVDFTA